MSLIEIVLISIGLAMDAFGVSIGKGLTIPVGSNGRKITLAFLFGLFQFIMPVIGWLIGRQFIDIISDWDHWIIFGLLGYLGIAMIRDGLSDEHDDDDKPFLGVWEMLMLSVATSLDAMAVGLTFAFLPINVWEASAIIGLITFGISLIGIYLGKFMGRFVGKYAGILGGGVLILIGTKILLQHLGLIG
ncbi:manganese efflux pump MntP family protein [Veillonella sp. AS16]|uniref:manganese efflux pump MntP n=1 Tax=Veillonella sp. AS16 TaxID=936589 RepID=UPI0003E29CA2|nr:manganese efflux pump MntP family protein [Veillonella sp. AS16]ETS93497.1 PF02659 domain protein [Veillonella sp. AS16]